MEWAQTLERAGRGRAQRNILADYICDVDSSLDFLDVSRLDLACHALILFRDRADESVVQSEGALVG